MKKYFLEKYQFVSRGMGIYGITVLIVATLARVCGDGAKAYSSLYQLGSSGMAYSTLLQLLASSFIITAISSFFFSERHFKNKTMFWRAAVMFISIFLVILCFIFVFKWIPFEASMEAAVAWGGFMVLFLICFLIATGLSIIKVKLEEKKYEELLKQYKEKKKGESVSE